jgi:hypothetical protein
VCGVEVENKLEPRTEEPMVGTEDPTPPEAVERERKRRAEEQKNRGTGKETNNTTTTKD